MEVKERTIFVSDVHGCIDELNELLRTLSYDEKSDRLILLGDLIDRGPDSVAVVQKARKMRFECVMGNHEAKYLKWLRSQGSRADVYDGKSYYSQFSDDDINYIANLPAYIQLEDVVAVHAGLKPGISISAQHKDDLMYLRYADTDGRFVSLKKINKIGKEAADAHFWTEHGPFETNIVYGHQVWDEPHIDRYADGTAAYGIDTGCCFGGKLTALIWETKEIVQVQAKKVYYQSSFAIR
jgi:bis(5'-nucleosyl)-tetraphosphatase (symmetrical)